MKINISKEVHFKMEMDMVVDTDDGGVIYSRTVNTRAGFVYMPRFMPDWILQMQCSHEDLYDYDSQNFR